MKRIKAIHKLLVLQEPNDHKLEAIDTELQQYDLQQVSLYFVMQQQELAIFIFWNLTLLCMN